jgi:hypothetical protein
MVVSWVVMSGVRKLDRVDVKRCERERFAPGAVR